MNVRRIILRLARDVPLGWCMVLGFAPWLLIPLVRGEWGVAATLALMAASISGLGQLFLGATGLLSGRPRLRIMFVPACGIILFSAIFQMGVTGVPR